MDRTLSPTQSYVSSSDYGDKEDVKARVAGEEYWTAAGEMFGRVTGIISETTTIQSGCNPKPNSKTHHQTKSNDEWVTTFTTRLGSPSPPPTRPRSPASPSPSPSTPHASEPASSLARPASPSQTRSPSLAPVQLPPRLNLAESAPDPSSSPPVPRAPSPTLRRPRSRSPSPIDALAFELGCVGGKEYGGGDGEVEGVTFGTHHEDNAVIGGDAGGMYVVGEAELGAEVAPGDERNSQDSIIQLTAIRSTALSSTVIPTFKPGLVLRLPSSPPELSLSASLTRSPSAAPSPLSARARARPRFSSTTPSLAPSISVDQPSSSPVRPASPSPPPEDVLLGPTGRPLRARTAAQLNPYSIEQAKYTKSLLKNGWHGAVVAGPKDKELSAEELRRKKAETERKGADDLDGWLVLEDGARLRKEVEKGRETESNPEHEEEDEESSGDGMDLLGDGLEARRRKRLEREAAKEAAGLGRSTKKKAAHASDFGPGQRWVGAHEFNFAGRQPSRSVSGGGGAGPKTYRKPKGRPPPSPHDSDPGTDHRANSTTKRHRPGDRHQSAPPTSSPARNQPSSALKRLRKGKLAAKDKHAGLHVLPGAGTRPSKGVHAREDGGEDGLAERDREILEVDMSSRPGSELDFGEGGHSDVEVLSDQSGRRSRSLSPLAVSKEDRFQLKGKRKKALRGMMPAVFNKKAEKDLLAMKREKELGYASGSDHGSGDEEAAEREEAKKGRARTRVVPRLGSEPVRFSGDAFTDESGSDGREVEPDTEEDRMSEEEGDAVGAWMESFAPQRRKGGGAPKGGTDFLDSLLKKARRTGTGGSRRGEQGRKAGPAKRAKEGRRERTPLTEAGNGRARGGGSSSVARLGTGPVQPRTRAGKQLKPVALDTDAGIFSFARVGGNVEVDTNFRPIFNPATAATTAVAPRTPSLVPRAPPSCTVSKSSSFISSALPDMSERDNALQEDNERWAAFGRFSYDFGITRLPPGLTFQPESFVSRGHLFSLVSAGTSREAVAYRAFDGFSLHFDSAMSVDEVGAALPMVCDGVFDACEGLLYAEGEEAMTEGATSQAVEQVGRAMRFLGVFASQVVAPLGAGVTEAFAATTSAQLDRLEARLDAMLQKEAARTVPRSFSDLRLRLSWYLIDLAVRLDAEGSIHAGRVQILISTLVHRLINHGAEHTTKALKAFMQPVAPQVGVLDDASVECWLGLVHLALSPSYAPFDEVGLWQIVRETVLGSITPRALQGPAAGEVLSYMAMMLGAVSQFSASGVTTSAPRLHAFWPVVLQALEQIKPEALARAEHTVSNTALARRDRYLWTLFARCLVFVDRWGWELGGGRDELLPGLFKLLNARKLADLTVETKPEFPEFVRELDRLKGEMALDAKADTAFVIFCKLVVRAARAVKAQADTDAGRKKQLTRLFLKIQPLTAGAWTAQSAELAGPASVLVNHLSLFLLYAALNPASISQRVDQVKRLVVFAEAGMAARQATLRAGMYFALLCAREAVPLVGVTEWLASVVVMLKGEYHDVEKSRRLERRSGARTAQAKEQPLWQTALLVALVLRAVQLVLGQTRPAQFPDRALLHPAWTSGLLESGVVLDPMIGREVIQTIDCFLDTRRAALKALAPAAAEPAGDSQDEFGQFDELDYDDPALAAMFGMGETVAADDPGPGAGAVSGRESDAERIRRQEKAFAEVVRDRLSPAFWRLVSTMFDGASGGGAAGGAAVAVADQTQYAKQVVECWTRCLTVLVENDLTVSGRSQAWAAQGSRRADGWNMDAQDWTPFIQYGDHSWRRISDPVGKKYIGMLLAIQVLKHDPAVYPVCSFVPTSVRCEPFADAASPARVGSAQLSPDAFLEIWAQAIVASSLTAQWQLTRLLTGMDRPSALLEGAGEVLGEDEEWFEQGGRRGEVLACEWPRPALASRAEQGWGADTSPYSMSCGALLLSQASPRTAAGSLRPWRPA